jgi:hypothetical protein
LVVELKQRAHDLDLKPSARVYNRYGKGPSDGLPFSKNGDARLEAAYATHFVWSGQRPFHPRTPGDHANARLDARWPQLSCEGDDRDVESTAERPAH